MSLLAGCSVFVCIASLALFRPTIFVCFLFILFTFVWRTISSMYVDLAGPVFASQLEMFIGPGAMTVFQSIAYCLTILPFLWMFNLNAVGEWARLAPQATSVRPKATLSDATFVVSVVFLFLLFAALIQGGVIPIFAKMERWTFNEQASGVLHHFVIERGDFLCFWWGTMFAAEKLRHSRFDYRYLGLLAVILIYMFLVGGRFSPFYRFGSFFLMPFSAVVLVHSQGIGKNLFFGLKSLTSDRRILGTCIGLIVLTGSLIAFALYWNLTKVRGFEGQAAEAAFLERILVQPSEIGWASYHRVLVDGRWDARHAFDFLFEKPIVSGRNTTPQYLMAETIGEPRTTEHIVGGFQFAGGFPEIFFELFGPYVSWIFLLGAGWLAAGVSAVMVLSIVRGHYLTTGLSFYVLFGFYVMYIGGMLNFIAVPTYWAKVCLLLAALILEERMQKAGLSPLPWILIDDDRILWFRRQWPSSLIFWKAR
jgi:hypothetical protein